MSDSTTITREQLRTVLISTELGGKEGDSSHFSYAGLGKSTYSFGQMQFDVGKGGSEVKGFLKSNGFDNADIEKLSKHGGLSQKELDALDTKLQAIPQATIDRFTNDQLDKTISGVGDVIDQVRQINPAMADAIAKDPKLQLGIADYQNQFGKVGPQAAGFLAGISETLSATGITVQAGNPPTREDLQTFIGAGGYGHDPANARGVEGRAEHFNKAMGELGLGPATKVPDHTSEKASSLLKQGAHGEAVGALQSDLGALGYTDSRGQPLHADDRFGPATTKAVESFQKNNGLKIDGVAGPTTLNALREQVHNLEHARGPYAEPAQAVTKDSAVHDMFEAICRAAERGDTKGMLAVGKCYEQSPEGQSYLAMGAQLNRQQDQIQAQGQTINQQATQIEAQTQAPQQSVPVMSR
jgi:peptidoglycan hydrolase-like protein with peptidoglycan-binding domain